MTTTTRYIRITILSILTALFLSSCCGDCFDDLEGSIQIKLNFNYEDTVNFFNPNRLERFDSLYLIKTTKGNLNEHLDTIYQFEKEYFTKTHVFILNSDQGFDYILRNRDPEIKMEITEFESAIEKGKGRCDCVHTESLSYRIDGTKYEGTAQQIVWVNKK